MSEELRALFKELAALQVDNERLTAENVRLREEVSLLRLYIDTYLQSHEPPSGLREMNLISTISQEAMDFYESLPDSFNFSELFELADLLGVEKHQIRNYITLYLREDMMQQRGSRVEKVPGSSFVAEPSFEKTPPPPAEEEPEEESPFDNLDEDFPFDTLDSE